MKLIIGGRAQGKLKYVYNISGLTQADVADGSIIEGSIEEGKSILYHLEDFILQRMKKEIAQGFNDTKEAIIKELKDFSDKNQDTYLICNEVGLGLVPCDAFERKYREMVGRVLCELASQAESVHRVYCGIGTIIKG